jgi:hypothetical protein
VIGLIYGTASALIYLENVAAKHNAVMVDEMKATAQATVTYDDYEKALRSAAAEKGLMIDASGNLVNRNRDVIESGYLLSESQWKQGESAEFAADMAGGYAAMLEHMGETIDALPEGASVDIDIDTEAAMAALNALQEKMENDLSRAMEVLVRAQDNWKQSLADDLVAGLHEAGVEGDEFVERLRAIDRALGTELTAEHLYNVEYALEMPELLQALLDDPGQFVAAAAVFVDYFMPLETSVASAQAVVDELQADLDAIAKEYEAVINITTVGSIPELQDQSATYTIFYRTSGTGIIWIVWYAA